MENQQLYLNLESNEVEFNPRANIEYKIFDTWVDLYDYLNNTNLLFLNEHPDKKRRHVKKKKDYVFTKLVESECDDPEHENFISSLL